LEKNKNNFFYFFSKKKNKKIKNNEVADFFFMAARDFFPNFPKNQEKTWPFFKKWPGSRKNSGNFLAAARKI